VFLEIISVSKKPSDWVRLAINEYVGRLPVPSRPKFTYLNPESSHKEIEQKLIMEAKKISRLISKGKDSLITLDIRGENLNNEILSGKIRTLRQSRKNVKVIIGGSEGLHSSITEIAEQSWSLSSLVLPHQLVQVLFIEQLYRTYSIEIGHPYHRGL